MSGGLQGPAGWHFSVKKFLPPPAYKAWILDWLRRDWEALWHYDRATPDAIANADHWFAHLVGDTAYGAATRHYHTLDHLVHGLSEIAVWAANTHASGDDIATVKKAYWFHDAVHHAPRRASSNQEESARLWLDSRLDPIDAEAPARLIRATDHLRMNGVTHPLQDVMLGVDLAIFGQSHEVYDQYTRCVRMEYRAIAEDVYRENRKKVMLRFQRMAQAGTLYPNRYFSELYLETAMHNIAREIAALDRDGQEVAK